MNVTAEITGINYTPLLCRDLNVYTLQDIIEGFPREGAFKILLSANKQFAVSWWVSAKRTRSYPYERVYETLSFSGKKITIIPIWKDEGKRGDRDYLQWDTISLMSLLGVYVIIAYYSTAEKSFRYENKITNQRFDKLYLLEKFHELSNYQSDALHWNLEQVGNIRAIANNALKYYKEISKKSGVEMHSEKHAIKRIEDITSEKDSFMNLSRSLAHTAQQRESVTTQPKEFVDGTKCTITIKNYLGGNYFFTADEIIIKDDKIELIEAKHTKSGILPSVGDIKDGIIKMILFTNLKSVMIGDKEYKHKAVLKLTSGKGFDFDKLSEKLKDFYRKLEKEAEKNRFEIRSC